MVRSSIRQRATSRRAISNAPDFVGAIIDRGRALKEQNRYEAAIKCFRSAIEMNVAERRGVMLEGEQAA